MSTKIVYGWQLDRDLAINGVKICNMGMGTGTDCNTKRCGHHTVANTETNRRVFEIVLENGTSMFHF